MRTQSFLVFLGFILCFLSGSTSVEAKTRHHPASDPSKLFVFGDSYADTGNTNKTFDSWKVPYGMSFPGKPYGHFSDGRVLTEFVARFFGLKNPITYALKQYAPKKVQHGMNFAYGGTGVTAYAIDPNMSTQIDDFQQLISKSVFTTQGLQDSVALVSLAGNDYAGYGSVNGNEGIASFIASVVNLLASSLERVHSLGVKKVAVTLIEPVGCLPGNTIANGHKYCIEATNSLAKYHNVLLSAAVAELNNNTEGSPYILIDLYAGFMSVLNVTKHSHFKNPLTPCCEGINSEYNCGDVDEDGVKKYTVCDDPEEKFFWDSFHPTQAGWREVYIALKNTFTIN